MGSFTYGVADWKKSAAGAAHADITDTDLA